MDRRLTLGELAALPTLSRSQADDLKIDEPHRRVWLSRCSREDGEPFDNRVTVEALEGGRWVTVDTYEAPLGPIAGEA
jgi:hypothetical protein